MTFALGNKVKFCEEKTSYRIRAIGERYAVCTRPFNPKHTVIYTVIDITEKIRGTENLVFGLGAETDEQCLAMLARLESGESEISHRNQIPLRVDWVRHVTSKTKNHLATTKAVQ